MGWVVLYPKVVCHAFKEQGTGKVFSAIFTFQYVLGVALEIKFNFTTQKVCLSYFRMAGFFHNHRTNLTKTRFTRHTTEVAHCFLSHCLSGGTLVDKPACKAYSQTLAGALLIKQLCEGSWTMSAASSGPLWSHVKIDVLCTSSILGCRFDRHFCTQSLLELQLSLPRS